MNSSRSYDSSFLSCMLYYDAVVLFRNNHWSQLLPIGLHNLPRFAPFFIFNKEFALHRCVSPYMCWFPFSAAKSHSKSLQGASLTVSVLYEYVRQSISHARLWIPRGVVMMDLASCEEHMLYYDGVVLFRNKHQHPTQTWGAFRKKDSPTKSFTLKESNTSCLHSNVCFGVLVMAWIA